jgi:hypothetical protein
MAASAQNVSECATASSSAAMAGNALKLDRVAIIRRQFFASAYFPAAEEEQVVANAPPEQIRIARVVDELGTAPTRAPVHKPEVIHLREVSVLGKFYIPNLLVTEAFSGVFDDAAISRNVLERKHSIAMKRRGPYSKIIVRGFRVDLELLRARRFHFASSKDRCQSEERPSI